MNKDYENAIEIINNGGVGILLTDTIYGIVGSALNEKAVDKIYEVKKRPKEKRLIVLAADTEDIKSLGLTIPKKAEKFLEKIWPGHVTVRFEIADKTPEHLHRGFDTLAVRVPAKKSLRDLLIKTGPLVAPSANLSGEPPVESIDQAQKVFGDSLDFYINEGQPKDTRPSTIIGFENEEIKIIREGAVPKEELEKVWRTI